MPTLRHRSATLGRHHEVEGGDDVWSWCLGCARFSSVGRCEFGRSTGKPGSRQDRGPTLYISMRDLPQIAAKRFQDEAAFRTRELSTPALHVQLSIGRYSRRLSERTGAAA